MSYLLFVAAAYAAQEKRRRARSAARKRAEERKKEEEKKARNSYYSERRNPEVSYLDCVIQEIQEDEVLQKFFGTLLKNAQIYRRSKGVEYEDAAKEMDGLIGRYVEERQKVLDRIKASGIQVNEYDNRAYSLDEFDLNITEREFNYANIKGVSTFNGLRITTADIENDSFRKRYEAQKAKCDELRKEKEELERKLKRQETLKKYIIFGRYDREEEIRDIYKRLDQIEKEIGKEKELEREFKTYEAFTPEQIKDIKDYLDASASIGRGINSIRANIYQFGQQIPQLGDKEVLDNALNTTMEELGMGEEEIADVFRRMDKVAIKRQRGEYEYSYKTREYRSSYRTGRFSSLVESFINNIYEEDPNFVERNMEEVLEDEATRDE